MTSLEFIAKELLTTPEELRSRCKVRELVYKRWVAMCYYRLMGFSLQRIGSYLGLDHQTVLHGIRKANKDIRDKAQECYEKYTEEKAKSEILPKKYKKIRVPNYHTNEVITKEVEI